MFLLNGDNVQGIFSSLVILIVVYLIYRSVNKILNRNGKFSTEFDLQNKTFKYTQEKNLDQQSVLVDKSFNENKTIGKLEGQSNENIVAYYNDLRFNDRVTNYAVYKEGISQISEATIQSIYAIRGFITENGLDKISEEEIRLIAIKRSNDIVGVYNLCFTKSNIDCIKKLTVKKIAGVYYEIFTDILYDCYIDIWKNHCELQSKMLEEEKQLLQNKKDVLEVVKVITNIKSEYYHKINKNDDTISEHSLKKAQRLLIGLFHDMLIYVK